jgi:hypothetical protein
VHPRIADRRQQVARERRSRWQRVGIAALVVVGLLAVAVGALFSPLLDVDAVRVTGVEGDAASAVVDASGVEVGDPLVMLGTGDAARAVEDLPWVAHAEVVHRWPDAVRVRVLPERPVALVDRGRGEEVVTSAGEVVARSDLTPLGELPALPVVAAPRDVDPATLSAAVSLVRQVRPEVLALLGPATVSAEGRLAFGPGAEAIEGATVEVGAPDLVPAKVVAIEAALGGAVELRCLERVDVSVPSRLTILRRAGCEIPVGEDR